MFDRFKTLNELLKTLQIMMVLLELFQFMLIQNHQLKGPKTFGSKFIIVFEAP